MKSGASIFLAALIALGGSWLGFVLKPVLQLGRAKQTSVLGSGDIYPLQRSGAATLGLQVYRANGCAACHTTQVRQEGSTFEVTLTSNGKNPSLVLQACGEAGMKSSFRTWPSPLPISVLKNVSKATADIAVNKISTAGGKTETKMSATGADIQSGWGVRQSVATDFLHDYPVQLGSQRVGPDLANIGVRSPDANWQMLHLYAPRSVVKNSAMPPVRFLFEVRKIGSAPSADALNLPQEFAPPAGFEVVPKTEARELVAYLLSLRANVPLYEAPFTP